MSESNKADEFVPCIVQAIRERRLVSLICDGLTRIVEPYLIYQTQSGSLLLHGWQVSGQFRDNPPPHWCNLKLEAVTKATPLPRHFDRPHKGYNPSGSQFHKIFVSVPPILLTYGGRSKRS